MICAVSCCAECAHSMALRSIPLVVHEAAQPDLLVELLRVLFAAKLFVPTSAKALSQ